MSLNFGAYMEVKKKLFEKSVGSLMDTLSSTDQRISVKRQLLSTTGSIEKLKSQKTSIVDQRSSYLTGELVGIAQELSSFSKINRKIRRYRYSNLFKNAHRNRYQ